MNTYKRSQEIAQCAYDVLIGMGLDTVNDVDALQPAVQEVMRRTGCGKTPAQVHISRFLREMRGLIVGDYMIVNVTTLPHPPDAESVPVVEVKETR